MSAAELPLALRPWKAWLGWFDARLAEQLGQLLLRLSDLIGPAPAVASHAALEPDGLDDLHLRGSYERLLSSEWLLADEMPDEFLRRAVASEHLFLAPRLRGARIERHVVAVFDTGPLQLGAARLAHIAAWILLARRAAAAGGVLRWGALQAPAALHPTQGAEDLQALLAARQLQPADAAPFAQWRAAMADLNGEVETWWIGTGPPAGQPAAAGVRERALVLRPGLEPRTLDARVEAGARVRRAELQLPPDRAATSLLRGEFMALQPSAAAVPTLRNLKARRLSLARAPLLSFPAGHVAAATLQGHAMQVLSLPRSGQARQPSPRVQQWSSARPPVAAMLTGRQAAALCLEGQSLHFWHVERFGVRPRPDTRQFEANIATAHWLPMVGLKGNASQRVCVIDRAKRLVAWDGPSARGHAARQPTPWHRLPTVFDKEVLAMMPLGASVLAYVVQHPGGLGLRELPAQGTPAERVRTLGEALGPGARVLMAAEPRRGQPEYSVGALAVCATGPTETWQVHMATDALHGLHAGARPRRHEIVLARGEKACGLLGGLHPALPTLVVQSVDRRQLHAVTPTGRTLLHREPHRMAHVTVCPHSGLVAMLTSARDLLVLDANTGQLRMAFRDAEAGGDPSPADIAKESAEESADD